MRAYIQRPANRPGSVNLAAARLGFYEMGIECLEYQTPEQFADAAREDVVVGGIGMVRFRLEQLGVAIEENDYPPELEGYLGRRVWRTTMNRVANSPESWPVFAKPVEGKRFTGKVIRTLADLEGCGSSERDPDVWCSEPVDFKSEWRCFVRYGKVLGVRQYFGDWSKAPDRATVESAVADYASAPAGYAIDFGVTEEGKTLLVEVNEGYSLGSYGLPHLLYAQLLAARWAELVGVPDELGSLNRDWTV